MTTMTADTMRIRAIFKGVAPEAVHVCHPYMDWHPCKFSEDLFFNAHGIGDREEIESEGIVGGLY